MFAVGTQSNISVTNDSLAISAGTAGAILAHAAVDVAELGQFTSRRVARKYRHSVAEF